ncbi:hypothetical protein PRZ48_015208 [Zasmidium cellare]|uniref:Thaumatin-like protein n=1 Tax=Zasmidium cellare TaxID=395010 RepID=A0ABR0DXX3_ZASCE|nr:hypothetical protein PRZ48_015208 [Zasmidium cellare]
MKTSVAAVILTIASAAKAANVSYSNFVFMDDVTSPRTDDVSQICFNFNTYGGLQGFYYATTAPWGSLNGYQGTSGTICVPTVPVTNPPQPGGAMFISGGPNPGPGNTKLECYFPEVGTANCDMSIVDGYSNSVGCVPGYETNELIGGYEDLYGNGINCPDQQGVNCINVPGPTATSESQVDPFFQQGTANSNNYCVYSDCGQDYYFPSGDGLICSVGL